MEERIPLFREVAVTVDPSAEYVLKRWGGLDGLDWLHRIQALRLRGPFPMIRRLRLVGKPDAFLSRVTLRITMFVPAREDTSTLIKIEMQEEVAIDVLRSYEPEQVVRMLVERALRHELYESIYVGEERPFDPHRGETAKETSDARREAG